ncbi:MAG: type II toxin-antitoxin system PemK/MazF family toxin [Pyrinomonadaceae bacterium]
MPNPNRGEVWLVDLGYAAKVRPCLILSVAAADEDRALATLVPHTTSVRVSRFEVVVKVKFLRDGAFDAQNLVTIPHAKLIRNLGALQPTQLTSIEDAVRLWLDL